MVTTVNTPAPVFPGADDIPEKSRIGYYDAGARYLVNGQVHAWSGPCEEVLSPVCISGNGGPLQYKLGHYPRMTEKESLQALDAACRAYNKGCGEWPTMSVADRISRIEKFTLKMIV